MTSKKKVHEVTVYRPEEWGPVSAHCSCGWGGQYPTDYEAKKQHGLVVTGGSGLPSIDRG